MRKSANRPDVFVQDVTMLAASSIQFWWCKSNSDQENERDLLLDLCVDVSMLTEKEIVSFTTSAEYFLPSSSGIAAAFETHSLARPIDGAQTNIFASWTWTFTRSAWGIASSDAKDRPCRSTNTTTFSWECQRALWYCRTHGGIQQSWLLYWTTTTAISCPSSFISAVPRQEISSVFIKSIDICHRKRRWWDLSFDPAVRRRLWVQSGEFVFVSLLLLFLVCAVFSLCFP